MKPRPAYSIGARLSRRLFALMLAMLGLLCAAIYGATGLLYDRTHQRLLDIKVNKLAETAHSLLRPQDERFLALLRANAQRRPGSQLQLWWPDGRVFYADPDEETHRLSGYRRARDFTLAGPQGSPVLLGRFAIDVAQDQKILRSLAVVLLLASLLGALAAAGIARAVVRQGLRPLRLLTRQTDRLDVHGNRRLALARPVAELQPWVERFNALLARMEGSYAQLEAFNADVAHELRTPLTALIGQTELALSRARRPEQLENTLASNLEALQRMAGLVNDMLFLARSDRGANARRGAPVALRGVIGEVLEFHEAAAAEQGLRLRIEGDAEAAVDAPLVQRAVSNLLSNATRHASSHTAVRVLIESAPQGLQIAVENQGAPVADAHLPRLFDRFYRADAARQDSETHHGLGLAIVAAIAGMHGGQAFARSAGGATRIGFWVKAS